jgi:hypothetical protein
VSCVAPPSAAVDDVRSHVVGEQPWLAADPTLAPVPEPQTRRVFQPGAWIVPDETALTPELEAFLDAGEAPVFLAFGSMRGPDGLSRVMIQAARALGRRAIVSRGWADLSLIDEKSDCLAVGEVNHHALFSRVAAVVHHGGAGTVTAAALAGAPQVVIPQNYDQHYWASRIEARHRSRARTDPPIRASLASPGRERPLTGEVRSRQIGAMDLRDECRPSASSSRAGPARRVRSETARRSRQSSNAHPLAAQLARPDDRRGKALGADLDRLFAGCRDRGDRVRALVGVRTKHDHGVVHLHLGLGARPADTACRGAATLLSSHAGDPRPATSDTANGGQASAADNRRAAPVARSSDAASRPARSASRTRRNG